MTESVLVTWENKVLPASWLDGASGRANRHAYSVCGSEVIVGGLDNPDRILSTEYDTINVFEATECTEDAIEKLNTRLRNNVMPFQQLSCDCNPGPPNHWLNKRAERGQMVRIKTRHTDNPSLTPAYLEMLSKLTGHRRARLFEGRWTAAEGGVFPEFETERHVVKPFQIPSDWPVLLACDPGYAHVCAFAVCAVGPNGRLYIIAERVIAQQTIPQHAAWLTQLQTNNPWIVRRKLGDPHDMFKHTLDGNGRSKAEQFADYGHRFEPAPNASSTAEVSAQVELIRTKLVTNLGDGEPAIQFFDTCPMLINAMQSWSFKKNTKGQLTGSEDQYEEAYKDEADAIRQIVASNPTFKVQAIRKFGAQNDDDGE